MRALIICAFCLFFFSPVYAQSPAPLISYDGLMRYIIEQDGRPVLLNFWATWCGPCQREIPGLIALRDKYGEDELHMVGVSLDYDPVALSRYLKNRPFNYPILLADPDLMRLLKIRSIPKTILYDRHGHEVLNYEGYISDEKMERWVQKAIKIP